tara:strand:+ start:281 stop:790 length:510 start_codon:yes stop_codon:yes gene_type:complete
MTDRVIGKVSITPIVTLAAATDTDAKDTIHHDIKTTLSGAFSYTKSDAGDKWYYNAAKDVTESSTDIFGIGESFTEGGTIANTDKIKFIFLKNTGYTDTGIVTTSNVWFDPTGGNVVSTSVAPVELGPGEALALKMRNDASSNRAYFHAACSSGIVRCIVVAIIDDISV